MIDPVHICCLAKNEGKYLREWLLFHQLIGVSHILLYDNSSTDDTRQVIQPFVESGFVDVVPWLWSSPCQLAAYHDAIYRYRGRKLWLAFIDLDEFLFSPLFDTIPEALESLCQTISHSAFGVNWCCFGSGNRLNYSSEPVIERFIWRLATSNPVNTHIKSLVWMNQQVRVGGDPHYFDVQHGTYSENGDPIHGPLAPHSSAILRINHYVTKSAEELRAKIIRGRADVTDPYSPGAYDSYHAREIEDRDIQRFLPELRQRLKDRTETVDV